MENSLNNVIVRKGAAVLTSDHCLVEIKAMVLDYWVNRDRDESKKVSKVSESEKKEVTAVERNIEHRP